MKRLLLSFISLFTVVALSAQSLYVGKVTDTDNLSSIPYDNYLGVCSSVSSSLIQKYAGSEIIGLRIALGSSAVSDFRAFLSADPDPSASANDLASVSATAVSEDWNDLLFAQPYTLKGTEKELYVGYYFSCASTSERPVLVGSSQSAYGLLVYESGSYGAGWYDYSSTGDLAVQLILRGGNVPDYDVALENLSVSARYVAADAESLYMSVDLVNKGAKALPGLTLSLTFDDNSQLGGQLKVDEAISGTMQLPLQLPFSSYQFSAGRHTLTLKVEEAKDVALDANTLDDDFATCEFYVYENAVARNNTLMEVYMSSGNQYDNSFVSPIEQFLAANPSVVPVFIHGNFDGNDPLAVDGAEQLAQVSGLQSVPSFGFNRTPVPGAEDFLYSYISEASADDFKELLDYLNGVTPSFATLTLTGNYSANSRLLTLSAKGTATSDFRSIFSYGALTIYLTENDVNGQNHVLRKILTAPLGNVISWNLDGGLGFSRDYRITPDASWDLSKMQAVAFVSKMTSTASRHDNMDVTNVAVLALSKLLPDAVSDLQAQPAATNAATYDLSGRRTLPVKPGLYIRNGKKVLVR
ncbi:MAG: hypothetical protein K6C30_02310 [Bacteroidaceae bacterium]|nr:hypothetical protein [Bacteroidaceae bacterium]